MGKRGKSLKRREKVFLVAGAAAALLFFAGRWVLLPVVEFTSQAPERIEGQLSVLKAYQAVVAREVTLDDENKALDRALRAYRASFLPGETEPLAAAALEARLKEIAGRAGVNIVSKKILKSRTKEHYIEVPMQVVATGSIENFRDFIVFIEGSELHVGIREMNLRSITKRQPRRPKKPSGSRDEEIQATMTIAGLMPA